MRAVQLSLVATVVLTCGVAVGAEPQLAAPSTAGPSTLAAAPQPRISAANQQLLRGTRPDVVTTIQGNALTPTNGVLPDAVVRLRDARYGRIVDTQVTDKTGLFTFRAIDPGIYVVELMGADHSVLAASELLSVDAGDTVTAIVKLPWRTPPMAGLLGYSRASAITVMSAAAASGVLATAVTKAPVSGER